VPKYKVQPLDLTRRRFNLAASAAAGLAVVAGRPRLAKAAGTKLRDATHPVLIRFVNHNPKAIYSPLDAAADIVTKGTYISPNAHTALIGTKRYFDHSDAGIQLAAANVANVIALFGTSALSGIAMFDVETYTSINVPLAAGYDPLVHRDQAAALQPCDACQPAS